MTATQTSPDVSGNAAPAAGLLARLGSWAATHLRAVLLLWLLVLIVFGAFAPSVESALSGAGWQDSGSQSVRAREAIAKDFQGMGASALQVVVHDSAGPSPMTPQRRPSWPEPRHSCALTTG